MEVSCLIRQEKLQLQSPYFSLQQERKGWKVQIKQKAEQVA